MSELAKRLVKITAEERPHPALRKLARACIALALNAVEKRPASSSGSDTPSQEQPRG
jgi:hypothetical protein